MADDAIDPAVIREVDKELRTLAKDSARYRRNLTSTITTIAKGAQTRKLQNKIIKEHIKEVEKLIKAQDGVTKQSKERIKLYKEEIKETKKLKFSLSIFGKALAFVGKLFFGLAKGTAETAKMMLDAGQEVKGFGGLLQHYGDNIPLFGKGLQAVANSLDFTVANFKTLAQQGADFGKSMVEMRLAAGQANMPLLQFVDLMQANTQSFARFFGTTNQGIPAIATMARSMRDFTKSELAQFGLNFEETNEYMATYLELQRSTGRAETMSTQQLVQGSQAYVKQLVRLARLTGQSTDELNRQMEQQKQNGVLEAALAKRSPEEADRLRELVTSLGGATGAYGGLAVDMIAAGAPMTEVSRKLAGANSDILNTITKFINDPSTDISATISNVREASNQFLKDFPQAAAYFSGEFITILDDAAKQAGKAVGEGFNKELVKSTNMDALFTGASVGFQEQIDLGKKSVEMVTANFMKMAADSGEAWKIIDKAGQMLVTVTKKAEDMAGTMLGLEIRDGALKVFVVNMWEKMADATKQFTKEKVIPAVKEGASQIKEFVTKGKDDKGILENTAEQGKRFWGWLQSMPWPTMAKGTEGATGKLFNNFGSGQPIALHGSEAVVPENSAFGQALTILDGLKNKSVALPNNENLIPATADNNNIASLTAVSQNIATSNEKIADHLNKLLTVGIMTEKNTNKTKISLENMSGTLV
jgi:hypothetical protein